MKKIAPEILKINRINSDVTPYVDESIWLILNLEHLYLIQR
jgi:hypothetical protein